MNDNKTPEFPTPEEINKANATASTGQVRDDGRSAAFLPQPMCVR